MSTLIINEGTSQATGITTRTHFADGEIVIEKAFDAQPYVEYAKQAREATEGQRWGEGKIVGTIPPAFYAQVLLIKDPQERKKAVRKFFQENPAFVTYSPYLKK
jgi:hypothetical protein